MKIGVYVGSFDPVHKGHKRIIDHVSNIMDKLIIIPTKDYWDKKPEASLDHRINMLKFYENEKIEVSIDLNKYQFTYQILEDLKKTYPNDTFYLIIGADNLKTFHLWEKVYEILKICKVLVLGRDNIDMRECLNKFVNKSNFIIDEEFELTNISSSEIRNSNIISNKYLDDQIIDYIEKNNLYKSHN